MTTSRSRPAVVWGTVVAALVAGAGIFLLSRPTQVLSPSPAEVSRAQPAVQTTPLQFGDRARTGSQPANSVDGNVAKLLLGAIQGSHPRTSRPTAEWIRLLKDGTQSLSERRQAARALASEGSDAGMAALQEVLPGAPSALRSAIAEALGESPRSEAGALLLGLLNDRDEATGCGAVRGLAARHSSEAIAQLGGVLQDKQKPLSVRAEAALSLGTIEGPEALRTLTQAASDLNDSTVLTHVLKGVGERPFGETEGFFTSYLESPNVSTQLRVAALEALGGAKGDPSAFLAKYTSDSDPELRAAAAWALSTTETQGNLGPELASLLRQEKSVEVRTRLYQALANQENGDLATVSALVQGETQTPARLAGFELLAGMLAEQTTPEALTFFNQTAVPELKRLALSSSTGHDRLSSVIALQRAGTPDAVAALQQIAQLSIDPKVLAAAKAASSPLTQPRPGN